MPTNVDFNLSAVLDSYQSSINNSGVYTSPVNSVTWATDGNVATRLDLGTDGTNHFATGAVLFDLANPSLASGQAIATVTVVHGGSSGRNIANEVIVDAVSGNNGNAIGRVGWYQIGGASTTYAIAPPGRASGSDWRTDVNALKLQYNAYRGAGSGEIAFFAEAKMQASVHNRPTISVTGPSGSVTTTAKPTITWSFSGDGLGQGAYRVRVFTAAQYGAGGFNPQTSTATIDSGWVTSTSTSYTMPENLVNGTTYRAYVMAAQTLPTSLYRHETVDGTTLAALGASQYAAFTISLAAPPVPTSIQPVHGSTVTTDIPTLRATLGASTVVNTYVRAEWQLATDAGFTTNVRTLLQDASEQVVSGTVSKAMSAGSSELFQGTWYLRARELDSNGAYGNYSAANTLTVAHAPSATASAPAGQTSRPSGTISFSFGFSDTSPTDSQTAFQIIVERDSDGAAVYDSGKQTSTANSFSAAISNTYDNVLLRWKVRVWDSDDVASAYSAYAQFYARPRPTITPVNPTAAMTVDQPQPVMSFTISGTPARTITQYRFLTKLQGTSTTVDDSGWQSGSTASYTPTTQLTNDTDYTVDMQVIDNYGLDQTQSVNFDTLWDPPAGAVATVDSTLFDVTGRLRVSWPQNRDGNFASYRVYYRRVGDAEWTRLAEITTLSDPYNFDNYDIPANVPGEVVVTQVAYRFGVPVESSRANNVVTFTPAGTHYFLVAGDDTVRLSRVNEDSFAEEWEQETIKVLDRGRRIEKGTRWGIEGSLSGRIYDDSDGLTAAAQRTALEAMKANHVTCKLRTPFGDSWTVALGALEFSRVAGVGVNAYFDLSLEYSEVME